MSERIVIVGDIAEHVLCSTDLKKFYEHWRSICGDRPMPRRADFEPVAIGPLLHLVSLVDVLDDGKDYHFRVVGSTIESVTGLAFNHTRLSEFPHDKARDAIKATLDQCVAEAQPLYQEGRLYEPTRDYQEFRSVILPLSDDGETVTGVLYMMIFSGIN